MTVLAIDPGNEESAWCIYDGSRVLDFAKEENAAVRSRLAFELTRFDCARHVAIEMIACYGMAVGREVFDTCRFIGTLEECATRASLPVTLVYRREVKLHLCNSAKAKDGNVRQALLDLWGGKAAAVGKKASPGPLYRVSGDVWAAVGVAVTWWETKRTVGGMP